MISLIDNLFCYLIQEIKEIQLEQDEKDDADEMDVSDDDDSSGSKKKSKNRFSGGSSGVNSSLNYLKEENDSLRCQMEAYKNEVDLIKADLKTEVSLKDEQIEAMRKALQGMQQMITENATRKRMDEARVAELNNKLKKAKEFNIKIRKAFEKSKKIKVNEKESKEVELQKDGDKDVLKIDSSDESDFDYETDFEIKDDLDDGTRCSSASTFMPEKNAWLIGMYYLSTMDE